MQCQGNPTWYPYSMEDWREHRPASKFHHDGLRYLVGWFKHEPKHCNSQQMPGTAWPNNPMKTITRKAYIKEDHSDLALRYQGHTIPAKTLKDALPTCIEYWSWYRHSLLHVLRFRHTGKYLAQTFQVCKCVSLPGSYG